MSFQLLVSRGGLRQWPSPAAKGALDQEVGEMWVLGEQRAVQIRSEDVARDDTLGSILPIVAGAVQDSPQWLQSLTQVGFATVILKADKRRRFEAEALGLDHDVADVPMRAGDGVEIDEAQPRQLLAVGCDVVLPQ